MENWLTTGQAIDQLKPGEVAKSSDGNWYITKDVEGGVYFTDESGEALLEQYGDSGWCILTGRFVSMQWRILPKYVKFQDAMRALREGKCKSVTLHHKGKKISFSNVEPIQESLEFHHEDDAWLLTWQDLFEGQWTIEY